MKVLATNSAGFCPGVRQAVEKARHTAATSPIPVFTDGPLIHNREMMDQLKQEGVQECADPKAAPAGSHLVIRAHGIPPERRDFLKSLPVQLVDATCPDVARIQGLIRKYARNGYGIVIFGDAKHAEVVGLMGYAQGNGHVVQAPGDVELLPANLQRVCVVSQSTCFPTSYAEIAAAIRRRYPDAEILDTICESTKTRQSELLELARNVEAIVVVGGAHSANTLHLVELASNLRPTFHIQTRQQLDAEKLSHYRIVGLTAGASTPEFIIRDVRAALESMG